MTILNRLLKQRKNRQANQKRQQRRLSIEQVEDRRLMAADVALTDGVLTIDGGPQDDTALVAVVDDNVRVVVSSGEEAAEMHEFIRGDVNRIAFKGFAGDDAFVNATDIPSEAGGGRGRDLLVGGSADDTLLGRGGHDILFGGEGMNKLEPGAGDDLILASADDEVIGLTVLDQQIDLGPTDVVFLVIGTIGQEGGMALNHDSGFVIGFENPWGPIGFESPWGSLGFEAPMDPTGGGLVSIDDLNNVFRLQTGFENPSGAEITGDPILVLTSPTETSVSLTGTGVGPVGLVAIQGTDADPLALQATDIPISIDGGETVGTESPVLGPVPPLPWFGT